MPPRKRRAAPSVAQEPPPKRGLAYDILSHLFAPLGVPVLAGLTEAAIKGMPPNTVFAAVVDQHWILGLVGTNYTLVFDPLGLPVGALQHTMPGVSFVPWNRFGYQSMFSSVCGYYLMAVAKEIQHGSMLHTADVDRSLAALLPYRVARPDTMTEWYRLHRHYNKELVVNDQLIVEYVNHTYPKLGYMNAHEARFKPGQSAVIGSPLYHHAGIDAQTVHQRFEWVNRALRAADPQNKWPGLGEATVAAVPENMPRPRGERVVLPDRDAPTRPGGQLAQRREPLLPPDITQASAALANRASETAFQSPAGLNADPRNDAPATTTPENLVDSENAPTASHLAPITNHTPAPPPPVTATLPDPAVLAKVAEHVTSAQPAPPPGLPPPPPPPPPPADLFAMPKTSTDADLAKASFAKVMEQLAGGKEGLKKSQKEGERIKAAEIAALEAEKQAAIDRIGQANKAVAQAASPEEKAEAETVLEAAKQAKFALEDQIKEAKDKPAAANALVAGLQAVFKKGLKRTTTRSAADFPKEITPRDLHLEAIRNAKRAKPTPPAQAQKRPTTDPLLNATLAKISAATQSEDSMSEGSDWGDE